MKKLLVLGLILASINVVNAACIANNQICYDDTGLHFNAPIMESMTLAQMNAATPAYAGQLVRISDGLQARVCISSGTTAGGYTVLNATAAAVIGGLLGHCQ